MAAKASAVMAMRIIWRSRHLEIRVLGLEPGAASPAAIEAAGSFRHDAFDAGLTGFGERYRALAVAPCLAANRLTPKDGEILRTRNRIVSRRSLRDRATVQQRAILED
jgi:hypothetical protein